MDQRSLANDKAELRKDCHARRNAIEPKAAAAAANEVAGRVTTEIGLAGIDLTNCIVSAYWPLTSELDPRPAIRALALRGANLALPRTVGDDNPLAFHLWRPEDPLIEGRFKVMEPAADAPSVSPKILLVPLLAFDRNCRRLGYGKGHYDRTLQKLQETDPAVRAMGIAFAAQEVDEVPTGAFDQTLDRVITERAVHRKVS
ncbi:MAG: 5-formyltetrahydrofolate cyclo-ligase [Geminicoccales bacterium]